MRVTLNETSQSAWQAQNLEHLRYEYDLKPDDVVIDIGAYRGEWANEIRARYGCCVIAVEPTDSIDGWECETIKKAAWIEDGKLPVGGAFYYTSHYEDSTHEVECFDINTLLDRFDEIALVKINIEGAEYVLLDHIITHGYHKRIKNLQVQFHQLSPDPYAAWYSGIVGRLQLTHALTFRYSFCWENWQRNMSTEILDEDYVEKANA
jgi:hypothetical protein